MPESLADTLYSLPCCAAAQAFRELRQTAGAATDAYRDLCEPATAAVAAFRECQAAAANLINAHRAGLED